ncbi:unnamed protein product [Paramecium pentaurelia]|uniref:Uncharacterized protein n=1 Tax=Paramecium pentaurelia TaxID=43138 RepID=A0A8S1US86_9CILI|nr:unnamed protein product [Paramecium pentaurelia]
MPQEDIVQKLLQRIQILVDEVETLTALVDSNALEQQEMNQKYQNLMELYRQKELECSELQNKLNQQFRHNVKDHLQQISEERQHITSLLVQQRNDIPETQNHALYQLCQQKTAENQLLRNRQDQLEQENAFLHSENIRLRTYIQHEKMFRQLEYFNGNYNPQTVAPGQNVEIPNIVLDPMYEQKYLQEYLQSRQVVQ